MAFLSNLKGTLTGNVDKAMLCIMKPSVAEDREKKKTEKMDAYENLKKGTNGAVTAQTISAFGLSGKTVHSAGLRSDLVKLRDSRNFSTNAKLAAVKSNNEYYALLVKYNPSRLRISSHGGSQLVSGFGGDNSRIQVQSGEPAEVVLQVELIFDEVLAKDAFMWDKFSDLSIGGAVSSVSGVVKNIKGDGYTVQNQIEGLLGLVTRHETKQVLFAWGDMIFAGEVIMIDAKYTMFNPLGHPVRGVVNLQIGEFQDRDLDRIGSKIIDEKYWSKCYEEMLKTNSVFKKIQGGAGNLINLR